MPAVPALAAFWPGVVLEAVADVCGAADAAAMLIWLPEPMGEDELMSELERRLCCCSLSSRVSCVMMSDEGLRRRARCKSNEGKFRRRDGLIEGERDWIDS